MDRIMILGAGAAQVPLIRTAKEMGYETIVATIPGPYPGIDEADIVSYTDITDCEGICREAEKFGVAAVSTCCLETGLLALGYTCEKLGLPGPSYNAAEISVNKLSMKRAFAKGNVLSPEYAEIYSEQDLEKAMAAIGFPMVVKAVDLQGSRGVYVTRSEREARQAYALCSGMTHKSYCIAERYVSGLSFCTEAFVQNGHVFFVLPDGNIMISIPGRPGIPIGHYAPFDCDEGTRARICAEAEKAIRACGIDNCAVNMDLVLCDGKPYIIELTARAGATCLSELISLYFGVDYYRMILMASLGQDVKPYFDARRPEPRAAAATMLTAEKTGIVRRIELPEALSPDVYQLSLIVSEGSRVRRFSDAGDRIGQLIVSGEDVPYCLRLIEETLQEVHIEIEEE